MAIPFLKVTALAVTLLVSASVQAAATFVIVNNDGPGEGFNDTTPVAPVGGNAGTTLGQQRLNAFQAAANAWGNVIQSSVPIRIRANFDPQTCGAAGTVLGSAGPAQVFTDFPNAPETDTWFSSAQADALAGTDLAPAANDINATFNVSIDAGCSPNTVGWWYGTDPAVATPTDRIALLPVLLHEFGHGLGFLTFTSNQTGTYLNGRKDIWSRFMFDNQLNKGWRAMTDAERTASSINDPFLVWDGPNVNAGLTLLNPAPVLRITAPAAIAGVNEGNAASFGPTIGNTAGQIVVGDDGTAPNDDGCTPFTNTAALAGKIALIQRGGCNFTVKVANAQAAGAIGAVIYNNAAAGLPGMGGADPTVTIPSIGVSQALGQSIIAQTVPVNGAITTDPSIRAGTNAGKLRLHAPNPVVPGSSVSHFTVDASPNLLMEPAINPNLFNQVDLTRNLFQDLGWPLVGSVGPNPITAVTPSGSVRLDVSIPRTFAFTGGPGTVTCTLTPPGAPFTVTGSPATVPGGVVTVTATESGVATLTCTSGATTVATYQLIGSLRVPAPSLNTIGVMLLGFMMLGIGLLASRRQI
jgi:hypothetical protein